jgi:phosphohistidine phosphatase
MNSATINIFILRHGEADPRDAGIPDRERKLTKKGRRDVQKVLKLAGKSEEPPDLILTSPLRRAQESAALAAAIFKCERVVETKNLLPSTAPDRTWKEIAALPNVSRVLIAGHEPHLGRFVAFLLDATPADLTKGALVRIEARRQSTPSGVLKWMLTPRLARKKRSRKDAKPV